MGGLINNFSMLPLYGNWNTLAEFIVWKDLQIIPHEMQNVSAGNSSDVDPYPTNDSNQTPCCFQPQPSRTVFVIVIVDIVLSVATISGNLLVVLAVLRYRQLRSVTNVFVMGLAAADLLVGLNVPYYVLFYFDLQALSCQRTSCMLRYWFTVYASGCSMLCLIGVALDRYIAILHPLSYHRIMHVRHASAYVIAVWAYMGVVSSLPLAGIGARFDPSNECDLYYTHTKEYALIVVASIILITFLVTTAMYAAIFKQAWRHNRAVAALELNPKVRQETKTARMMALVMGVNFLGLLPYLSVITLRYLDGMNQDRVGSWKPLSVCFYFGKSAVNPFIYGWKNKDFRTAFKKLTSFDKGFG